MTTQTEETAKTRIDMRRRQIAAGEARCAVFQRTFNAAIEDVWNACTDPERLRRWYAPVTGDLRPGGRFDQGDFGPGQVLECAAPRLLRVGVGGGDPAPDEVTLRLSEGPDGTTILELEHATTFDEHEIGGQMFDAVYCMGGGYGPRLVTLDRYLSGTLADDVDATALHLRDDLRPAIETSMAALDELIKADRDRS